jgi:beta-xylosidase
LVESRPPGTGRGLRASVFRPRPDGTVEQILQATDLDGQRFGDVRTSVTDVSGDGSDDVVFAFYRLGSGEVLSVDLVESPGRVTVHRDYSYGSARATRCQLDGWADLGRLTPATSLLGHETIRFTGDVWRVATFETTTSTAAYARDFPDPFVLRTGSVYYGYSTNASGSNVPLIRSSDLTTWARLPDALPQLPDWSQSGRVWAPTVLPRPGGYVLYYATRNRTTNQQCVTRAWSATPEGPFRDDSAAGLICQVDHGGSIDPSPFVDGDGTAWLYWKSDGIAGVEGPRLWVQRLTSDGMALAGSPTPVLGMDQAWETPVIEGPAMVRDGDRYYLFYVAGPWQTAGYAIGYATCATPQGPCTKPQASPVLASTGTLAGPGGPEFVVDGQGQRWMSFHGWGTPDVGYPRGRRMLFLLPVRFDGGVLRLGTVSEERDLSQPEH